MLQITLNRLYDLGDEALPVIVGRIESGLSGVENQAATAEKYGSMDKGPATYGVVKRMRDNDMELHTDQQVPYKIHYEVLICL